jgi:hypothetical protein
MARCDLAAKEADPAGSHDRQTDALGRAFSHYRSPKFHSPSYQRLHYHSNAFVWYEPLRRVQ